LKREREEEQTDSPLWVSGELGSPTVKPPPDTRSPEGGGGKMDIVGRNKHVEVKDPEDSSTMEESVVTFSRQRRKEPLVGDLVSSPESVGSNMEKREDAVLDMDKYRLERNGARENAGSNPEDVCYTPDHVAPPTPTKHQPFNCKIQETSPPCLSFPHVFPLEFPVPESVAAIPSPVETSSGFDQTLSH
jgi:hypothetical protein